MKHCKALRCPVSKRMELLLLLDLHRRLRYKRSVVISRDTTTVCLPQSLRQQPNSHAASSVLGTICHYAPAPSAINLKPYSWHRHWMLRQPRETLSSKQGGRSQTRHSINKTLQRTTVSRQQANGASVSSTKPQIQRKHCHPATRLPPQSLRQQTNIHDACGVLGTLR